MNKLRAKQRRQRRRRINPVSPKRQRLLSVYRREVKSWLALPENKWCKIEPRQEATQVHHRRGRLGTLLLDKRFWLPVSACGHQRIHAHPAWAQVNGWIAELGQWNTPPKDKITDELKAKYF